MRCLNYDILEKNCRSIIPPPSRCKENSCKAAFTTKQCLQFHYKKVHGLTEELMPKIERSVAYTFDAYSGGIIEDNGQEKSPHLNRSSSQVRIDAIELT